MSANNYIIIVSVDLVSFEACLKRSCLRQSVSTDEYRRLSRQSLHCSSPISNYSRCQDYPYSYNNDYSRDSNRYDQIDERAASSSSNAPSARARLTNTTSEQSLSGLHNHTLRRFQAKLQRQHSVFFADSRTTSPGFVDYEEPTEEPTIGNYFTKNYQSHPDQGFSSSSNKQRYQTRTNLSPASESPSTLSSMPSRTVSFSQISQLSNDDYDPALINCFMSDSSSDASSDQSPTRLYLLKRRHGSSRKQNIIENNNVIGDTSNKPQSVRCWTIATIDNVAKQCSKYMLAKIWFPLIFISRQVSLLLSRGRFQLRTMHDRSSVFVTQQIRHIAIPLQSTMINNEANNNRQVFVNILKLGVIILLFQVFCIVTRPLFDCLFDKLL